MEAPRRIDAVEETEITCGFVRLVIIITPGIMRDSVVPSFENQFFHGFNPEIPFFNLYVYTNLS